jgi:hypothetical protein
LPRFSPPPAATAWTIPSAAEKKDAARIITEFAAAETILHANDREATRREIAREFREEKIYDLRKKLDSQDRHKFGEAAGLTRELRAQAAVLAASLLDKLAKLLADNLSEIAVRLESELLTAGLPLSERVYEGGGSYKETFALHRHPDFDTAQLRLALTCHCASRLKDESFVSSGCAAEFATLKWFLGDSECPLSV